MKKSKNNLRTVVSLLKLVSKMSSIMAAAVLLGTLGHIAATLIPALGYIALSSAADVNFYTVSAFLLFCAILRGFLRYGEQYCNHYIAFKTLATIRDKVFEALRKLCPAKLEGRERGNLISIITSDVELLEVFYAHTISPVLIAVLHASALTAYISTNAGFWAGAFAASSYIVVGFVVPVLIYKFGGSIGVQYRNTAGELSSAVLDSLRGLTETMQYDDGANRLNKINAGSDKLTKYEKALKMSGGLSFAGAGALITAFGATMLILLTNTPELELSTIMVCFLLYISSFGPTTALAALGSTLQNTMASAERVLAILDEEPVTPEIFDKEAVEFCGISTDKLNFAYDEDSVLCDVDIDIKPHMVYGISGRSGSGKSTLLRLLMRFWTPSGGSIKIGSKELDEINTENLRKMESFVTQEVHLFRDTIAGNLRIAKLNATDEEMQEACRKASLHDFVASLPKGYETNVGELGDALSGGERQRLGVARAFLSGAPLMLLDEPTSNLDSLNEAIVLKSLHEHREDKTIVIVSHRASTMKIADRILTITGGRIS